ncbi:cytochrome P450 [Auriscalpium vulgare]|uniref:Cytochrome P450 n=1 Tax=Auriscalpium vulgare TaxID=40419 RepID=A0ACB8S7T9_9AGAM|nr:cytochrome P450 [Auriscalpium vulgare]
MAVSDFWVRVASTALAATVGLILVRWILRLQQAFATIKDVPGQKIQWLDPFRTLSLVVGPLWPKAGSIGAYYGKFTLYDRLGSTVLSAVRPISGRLYYYVADGEALKTVFADRLKFQKDWEAYEVLEIYGKNLVGAEGSEWKRHKGIASPAFNEANNALVWSETIRIMHEWFVELDAELAANTETQTNGITLDIVPRMIQATLLIIAGAGFGRRVSWTEDAAQEIPPGHTLSFSQAVAGTVGNLFVKVLTPNWLSDLSAAVPIPGLSWRLEATRRAFFELQTYMLEIVGAARDTVVAGLPVGDAAILQSLVQANMQQEGDAKALTDDELLSNIFVFLLAGHETSAHSLSFAIVLLALYPEVQQKVYDEAAKVWPGSAPVPHLTSAFKDDFPKFEYTLAAFRETLRLFPAEPRLAKIVAEDARITAAQFSPHKDGHNVHRDVRRVPVAIPKGSVIIVDIYGVHRNPFEWGADCKEFKPERFVDTEAYRWPRHAFLTFSAGARACLGSRFALAESVCTLACLVRRYEILLPNHVVKMDIASRRAWLTKWTTGVTITPVNAMVKLRRREQ